MGWVWSCLIVFVCGMCFQRLLGAWINHARNTPGRRAWRAMEASPSPMHAHARGVFTPGCLACRLEDSGGASRYAHAHEDEVTEPIGLGPIDRTAGAFSSGPIGAEGLKEFDDATARTAHDRHRLNVIRQRIARDGRLLTLPKEGRRGAVEAKERVFFSRLPESAHLAEGWPILEDGAPLEDFINPKTFGSRSTPSAPTGTSAAFVAAMTLRSAPKTLLTKADAVLAELMTGPSARIMADEEPTEPEAVLEADDLTPIGVVLPGVALAAKRPPIFTAPYPFPPRRTTAPGGFGAGGFETLEAKKEG